MNNNDAQKSPVGTTTSTFKFKRNTKGIMNFATESPSRSSVVWAKDTPVKERIAMKLKSSQDPSQVSPKPNVKKFISSPLLTVPNYTIQNSPNTLARKAQIDQRLCEEFEKLHREVNKGQEYKPRNILDNLNETSNKEKTYESKSKSTGSLCSNITAKDDEYDEMDDIEFLTQLENEARKRLDDKTSLENNYQNSCKSNVNEIISKMESKNETMKQQIKIDNKPLNSINDEDNLDEMMLSIPIECLIDPNFAEVNNGTLQLQKPLIDPHQSSFLKQNSSVKRPLNKSLSPEFSDIQPVAKKIFTKEECEQKRLEALKRRQEFLKKRQHNKGK